MGLGLKPSPPGHRVLYSATEEKDKREFNFGEIYMNRPKHFDCVNGDFPY